MKNIILSNIVVAIVAVVATLMYQEGHNQVAVTTSPAGSTFSTAKFYGVAINLANTGANGTSTSITNTDSNARFVTGYRLACSGVGTSQTAYTGTGLAALQYSIGTTTTSAPASFSSTFPVATNQTLGTSTVNFALGSTTATAAGVQNSMFWGSGVAMTFFFNATNTAQCTVGVDSIGS